jgi:hypothetical protein
MKRFSHDCIYIEENTENKNENKNKNNFHIHHLYSEQHNSYLSYIFSLYNIPHSFEINKLSFNCLSIQTFQEYLINNDFNDNLPYEEIIQFIYDIGVLIKSLEKHNTFIFCFSLNDFIILDNSIFLFINTNKIVNKISKSEMIKLNYPISIEKNKEFITKQINTQLFPFKCHYSYSYYNLALMIIYLLTGKHYEIQNSNHSDLLIPYVGTKLYFFLMRCLSDNEKNRCFLYI